MTDLYELLGVPRTATPEEIKKAYRKLARRYHPDVNPSNPNAEKRFREIQESYAVLSDTDKRAQYDQFGTVDEAEMAFRRAQAARREPRRQAGPRYGAFGGFADLGDLFGDLFRGMGPAAHPPGAPAEAEVELDFAAAVRGTSVVVAARREAACDACGGAGSLEDTTCSRCHGSGRLVHTERLRVRIPAGIGDGDRVHAGSRSGGAHDVWVRVRVLPHPFFERKGDDIHTVIPLTVAEAYAGGDIEVGTIHGPVLAKIPAGTQGGQRFRLRGKGVRNVRTGVNGDHYYTVQVMVPRMVSPAGREAARRLGELYGGNVRSTLPRGLD